MEGGPRQVQTQEEASQTVGGGSAGVWCVCVCVCEREREKERERVCVRACVVFLE